jgi:copper ion binding protein
MTTVVKKEFTVEGMSCGGCASSVTRAVQRLPGVQNVDVSLAQKLASVEYDGATVDAAAIVAAIQKAGFEAAAR